MARRRLTPLSRILIVALVVGGAYFGFNFLKSNGYLDSIVPTENNNNNNNTNTPPRNNNSGDDNTIDIGVVTWGGYAGGQYWNKGFDANTNSNFYKDYGFKVKFHVLDDFNASREAFKSDEVDLLWNTIDAFPNEVGLMEDYDAQVVFQADWSRGGDAVVVRREIKNVADLKGKKIAVAPLTPSHTFLLWLLDAGDLDVNDVQIVEMPSAIDAADAFKSGTVSAAVVWSPDDADCVAKVPGARVLESTKNASHIIADIFMAKRDYIQKNKAKLQQLYEGWMKGAAEINESDAAKQEAAQILADGLGMPYDFCYDAINNVRLTTHGDNMDFFGINTSYSGVTGEDLYNKMKNVYQVHGEAAGAKSWRLIANKDVVSGVELTGAQHAAEGKKTFTNVTEEDKTKEAISTKAVSISFRSGEYKLDDNAKTIIDLQFTDIAKAFSNSRIRIEGNTDNVGSRTSNIALSQRRAQSVADYLISEHNMPRNRFIIIGNGPDKPVASNDNETGRAQNRRTDFELVAN
ncbi:MAG: phosphate ABC transporter substrate-binding/OmpA family protein [Bacteroidota bacterium]